MKGSFYAVYITTPKGAKAKQIATAIVRARCAACVNVVPSVTSVYWWKGKMETGGEALLIVKTKKAQIKALIRLVQKIHPYSVPEIIALPIQDGNKAYLQWLQKETQKN